MNDEEIVEEAMMIAALLYLGGVERAVYFNDFVILFSRVAHPLIG